MRLVRPEDAGPNISLIAPRGMPPTKASTSATPVDSISAAVFSGSLNVLPKRPAISDSSSVFENATLMIYNHTKLYGLGERNAHTQSFTQIFKKPGGGF